MNVNRVTNDYSGSGIKTDNTLANLLNRGSQLFMEGVKNLVPKKHNLPLTKVRLFGVLTIFLSLHKFDYKLN